MLREVRATWRSAVHFKQWTDRKGGCISGSCLAKRACFWLVRQGRHALGRRLAKACARACCSASTFALKPAGVTLSPLNTPNVRKNSLGHLACNPYPCIDSQATQSVNTHTLHSKQASKQASTLACGTTTWTKAPRATAERECARSSLQASMYAACTCALNREQRAID
jgi:hypothetical protein